MGAGTGTGRPSGAWLRQSREAAGLSQEGLAARSGISIRTIRDLERGISTRPYPRSVRLLAKALALPPEQADRIIAQYRQGGQPPGKWPADGNRPTSLPFNEHSEVIGSRRLAIPRCLPSGVRAFTGRVSELAILARFLGEVDTSHTPVITAISGTAGVGKTSLALHWAHKVAPDFPDGNLYADLRGFDPSGTVSSPGEILAGFLDILGIPAGQIPSELAERSALYRSLLAGRRMLIVLDNARDEQQVRPLLPGCPRCLVIITSRRQMHGLAASNGAGLVPLGLLCASEARQLFEARLDDNRAATDPEAVTEIVELCARLPLALAITAARAAANPQLPLVSLVSELRDAKGRLDVLDAGDPPSSARAVFLCSYQNLTESAQQMFRLLSLHPGPDISTAAATSLAGVTAADARRDLKMLAQASLIAEHVPGRFSLHDLLRAYATELASAEDEQAGQAAAGRMLDHYLHTAHAAARLIRPARSPLRLGSARPAVVAERLSDIQEALDWFAAERQVLLAIVTLADRIRFDTYAWQIPWAMSDFLDWRGHWQDWAATPRIALAAATRLKDPTAQAAAHLIMGQTSARFGDHDEAHKHLTNCLELYKQLGDSANQARVHQALEYVAERQSCHEEALYHAEQALSLYKEVGSLHGKASALADIGWYRAWLGDYQQACTHCRNAIVMLRKLGDQRSEAKVWDSLGYVEHQLGRYHKAIGRYVHALNLLRPYRDRFAEAEVLTHLGESRAAAGDGDQARSAWQHALDIFESLHHPDAKVVRARLTAMSAQRGGT